MTETEARRHLTDLHQRIDERVAEILATLPAPLTCRRGCSDCCTDNLTVFAVEASLIRHHHQTLLSCESPGPVGGCAFLDPDGACRVYAQRPYVCRTQGLPLRWQDVDEGGQDVEMRDICPLNEEPLAKPLSALPAESCWTLGEIEGPLASLQAEAQNGFELRRVALRDLFKP